MQVISDGSTCANKTQSILFEIVSHSQIKYSQPAGRFHRHSTTQPRYLIAHMGHDVFVHSVVPCLYGQRDAISFALILYVILVRNGGRYYYHYLLRVDRLLYRIMYKKSATTVGVAHGLT